MSSQKDIYKDDEVIPSEMETVYFGLIRRGPGWSPEMTPETEQLQLDHLANIRRLHEEGQLPLVGPFTDGGELRGVFVFRAETLEEAESLAAGDPAVQAGRLVVEIHPWMIPAGLLP